METNDYVHGWQNSGVTESPRDRISMAIRILGSDFIADFIATLRRFGEKEELIPNNRLLRYITDSLRSL